MKRAKKRKNVKEEEEETEEEEPTENIRKPETDIPNKILLRAYPKTFTDAIQALTEDQKKWVTEAGFGPLLSFAMRKVPHSMCVNIIWWYDLTEDEMIFSKQRVKITEQDVADTLGLPKGEKEICFKKGKVNRDKFSRWRAQFPDKDGNRITELTVYEAITRSRVVDLHFKQNFMILMMNLFVYTNNSSFVCQDVLGFEDEFENASHYNWCKLVVESLRSTHEEWWDDPQKKYYTGSLVFLLVSKHIILIIHTCP